VNAIVRSDTHKAHLSAWRAGRLSDLVFSIETRLGALATAEDLLTENLLALLNELAKSGNLHRLAGSAHSFRNTAALRRALLAATYYIADARACYENLADVYREFLREFLGESISEARSREKIPTFSSDAAWAAKLWGFRNDLLHDRAPWLAFDVTGSESLPEIAAILTLDWRHGTQGTGTTISATDLQEIRRGLNESLSGVRDELLRRLEGSA
jgi:hypothetical protein